MQALCEWQEQRSLIRYYIQEEIDNLLSRTKHLFAPSIRCKFHGKPDIDIPHCSIAAVHRIWYIFKKHYEYFSFKFGKNSNIFRYHTTDYLCDAYKVVPTPKHLPSASNSFRSIEESPGDLISFQRQSEARVSPPMIPLVRLLSPPQQPTVPVACPKTKGLHLPSASNSHRSTEASSHLISFQQQSDASLPPPLSTVSLVRSILHPPQPIVPVVWPFTPPPQELPTVPLEWLQSNTFGI